MPHPPPSEPPPALLDALPELLRRVAEELGLETALALARELGGREVWLGGRPRPGGKIALAVGVENARRIARLLGAGKLSIPRGPYSDGGRKGPAIRALIAAGKNNQEIASAIGCHERTVRRHRNRAAPRVPTLEDYLAALGDPPAP